MTRGVEATAARARALLDLGRPAEAETFARDALAHVPDDADLHALLARALLEQERPAEARAEAEEALRQQPENLDGLALLAAAASWLDDHRIASNAITRAVELAPAWDAAHRQRAAILLSADKPEQALASADRAVTLNPSAAGNHSVRGAILIELRRFQEAQQAVTKALELDPQHQQAHRVAGLLGVRTGDRGSEARFREALRLDPSDRASQSGMNVAIKARNPVYRMLLAYSEWLRARTPFVRGAVSVAPFLLGRIALVIHDEPWRSLILGVSALFIVVTWSIDPVLTLAMLASRRDRVFVDQRERRSALAFLVFSVSASGSFTTSIAENESVLIPVGFGLVLWAFAAGHTHSLDQVRERRATVAAGIALACAVGCGVAAAADSHSIAVGLDAAVFLSGAVATWYVLIGSRRRSGRQHP